MRRLRDPSTSYDVLRDFGASYAVYPKRVSAVYFERLANALNQTATQLQEGDHQGLEVRFSLNIFCCWRISAVVKLVEMFAMVVFLPLFYCLSAYYAHCCRIQTPYSAVDGHNVDPSAKQIFILAQEMLEPCMKQKIELCDPDVVPI